MQKLIDARQLTIQYGNEKVLQHIDFSINEREIVTIVGPNGSGKSTLLRVLIGALSPDAGTLNRRAGLRMGYVPQRLSFDSNLPMSVKRFLSLGSKRGSAFNGSWEKRINIEHLLNHQIRHLSGGQLQRVLLAQALMDDPHLLILDEATQGLDQIGEASFYRLIEELRNERGCAVLLVSHDLHVVMSASDRVVCLNGHVCCEGTPTIVSEAPEYRALFGHGTEGALALYRHDHDHDHDHSSGSTEGHTHAR